MYTSDNQNTPAATERILWDKPVVYGTAGNGDKVPVLPVLTRAQQLDADLTPGTIYVKTEANNPLTGVHSNCWWVPEGGQNFTPRYKGDDGGFYTSDWKLQSKYWRLLPSE